MPHVPVQRTASIQAFLFCKIEFFLCSLQAITIYQSISMQRIHFVKEKLCYDFSAPMAIGYFCLRREKYRLERFFAHLGG